MDFTQIFHYLPLIMKAVSAGQQIASAVKGGASIKAIFEQQGPEVMDLIKQAGEQLFPNLTPPQQIEAGAQRFSMELTKKIQAQLNKVGASLDVDGAYGALTKAAVSDFQTKNGLDVDGWAGPLTQAMLNKVAP